MLRRIRLRYLALFGIGLFCLVSFCAVLVAPNNGSEPTEPTEPPAQPQSSNVMLLEANACTQDVVGEANDQSSRLIDFTQDGGFQNDEARSLALIEVKPNLQIRLFDSADADIDDDWVKVFVKQEASVYCVPSFEQTYEDDVVQVTYHEFDGLDGKVSLMIIEEGSYATLPSEVSVTEPAFPEATMTEEPSPTGTPAIEIPTLDGGDCIPTGTAREVGTLVNVIDGDTIDVLIDGVEQRIRYIGMDTPERGDLYFGEAADKNASLLAGQSLLLVKDVSEKDQFDRLLRYVVSGNEFANYELVRQGFAQASTYPPDVACSIAFAETQGQAISDGTGFWVATPTLPAPTQTAVSATSVEITFILFDGVVPRVESDEFARITNQGSTAVNLQGWRLNAGDPGQDYYFPNFILESGQSCQVYTNEVHSESCGFSFNRGQAIWNNGGDCGYLYDNGGVLASEYCY